MLKKGGLLLWENSNLLVECTLWQTMMYMLLGLPNNLSATLPG